MNTDYDKWSKFVCSSSDEEEERFPRPAPPPWPAHGRIDQHQPIPNVVLAAVAQRDWPHRDDWGVANTTDTVAIPHDANNLRLCCQSYPELLGAFDALERARRPELAKYLLLHKSGGVLTDPDVMPIAPIADWLGRFGRAHGEEGFRGENLLILGLKRTSTAPFELCPWTMAATNPEHPFVLAVAKEIAARRDASQSEVLTDTLIAALEAGGLGEFAAGLAAVGEQGAYEPGLGLLVLPTWAFDGTAADPARQRLVQRD